MLRDVVRHGVAERQTTRGGFSTPNIVRCRVAACGGPHGRKENPKRQRSKRQRNQTLLQKAAKRAKKTDEGSVDRGFREDSGYQTNNPNESANVAGAEPRPLLAHSVVYRWSQERPARMRRHSI